MIEYWVNLFGEIVETFSGEIGHQGSKPVTFVEFTWGKFNVFRSYTSRRDFLKNLKERGWERLK